MEPGTANTSRPMSAASRAVISEPDSKAASTTSTAEESAAIRRLRRGKLPASGRVPKGNSESTQPSSAMQCARALLATGYTRSMPVPHTATVPPCLRNAPSWAALSMPAAMPDTVTMPAAAKASPNSPAIRIACGVACRLPTMATEGRCSHSVLPRANNKGGAVMPSPNCGGKSASQANNKRQFACCSHASAASAAASASWRRLRQASCAGRLGRISATSCSAAHTAAAEP